MAQAPGTEGRVYGCGDCPAGGMTLPETFEHECPPQPEPLPAAVRTETITAALRNVPTRSITTEGVDTTAVVRQADLAYARSALRAAGYDPVIGGRTRLIVKAWRFTEK